MPNLGEEAGGVSDLQFIRQKAIDGDWITVTGAINAVNDTIEYIPANGKTFFLYDASIVMNANPGAVGNINATTSSTDQTVAALKVDTVTKDTAKIGMATRAGASAPNNAGSGSGFGLQSKCHFNTLGLILVGDGIKKVEVENILDGGSADANLSGWIEDT